MSGVSSQDDLIRRLCERAADPAKRVDNPPSLLWSGRISLSTGVPADAGLPAPATAEQIATAEREMRGVTFTPLLRRIYMEVANGGFGPGPGIVGVRGGATTDDGKSVEDLYGDVSDAGAENPARIWPPRFVPIADFSGIYVCVDCTTDAGRIVDFDFNELDGEGSDGSWSSAFTERAASLHKWLEAWVGAGESA